MPKYLTLCRSFLCWMFWLISLSLTAQHSLSPSLQVHAGWSQFWPENNTESRSFFSDNEFRRINAWAVGLAFQKPLRPKVAFQASWYYLESKERFSEHFWYGYKRSGIELDEDITSAPHLTQMTHLNLQIYVQQHGFSQETVELGLGLLGSLNKQYYRSGFVFNEQFLQFDEQEFTTRQDIDFGVSLSLRVSVRLRERWRAGIETSGLFFFDGDRLLPVTLSTYYLLRP